ncbi:MAG: S8 family serine peptidase, partial [Ruminococcus sp.]|nr:S8 family serine peptidase [Ruminococcus sp.]
TTTTAARTKATKAAAVSAKTKSAATKAATTKTTAANDGALSWGTTYAGLEDLVATANADSTLNKTTIAIIDTGVRKTHKIFKERTISSKSKAFDSISPKSLKLPYSYADIDENEGHGTHVAGIIADGTSKQVELLVIRAFAVDANGMPTASFFDVANAISYAVDQGVSVINFSGGENLSNKKSDYTTQTEYDIAMAQYKAMEKILKSAWKKGIFVAVASGNGDKTSTADQLNISKQGAYPARSSYAYTVGAIDKKYKRAYYSYYGKQLDFVAPGSQIMSASFEDDNEYITKSGTSMAAPNIAALAVMIKVFHPDYKRASIARVLRQRSSLGDNGEHTNQLGWGSVRIDGVKQTALKKTQTITNLANSYTVYYKESDLVLNPKTKRDVGFSYASSKPSVASANAAGKVTANGLGAAILTVHVDSSSSYDYAEKNVTIKSTLRKVTLKKLTAKKKKLKITWTPAKIADGYQIRYARKKDMSDAVTVNVSGVAKKSKTIKKLKAKKKYYVQVRLYKKLKGVTYYGAWSKKLKKKTK